MGALAVFLMLATALIFGIVVQVLAIARSRAEWMAMVIGTAIGGVVAGQIAWGPRLDGLYVAAALIGAIAIGALFEAIVRFAPRIEPEPGMSADRLEHWSPD
jgi:hypothetical protein